MSTFNPNTTAIVVVDMQNDFVHEDGALYAPNSGAAIDPVADLVVDARGAGAEVIYTRDVHPEDQFEDAHYYDEFEQWGEHVVQGTWGAEIVDPLTPNDGDYIVEKRTYDAFHETGLDGYLTEQGIDNLLICGTLANVCVLHTASSAGLRDYRPVLVEDAVGYIEEDHKNYALRHADWLFGEVAQREDIEWSG